MELGNNVRARRTELGMTLDTLAEKSSVSRAMLSDIERGAKSPTVRTITQIAAGLGCTVSELLGEPPPKPGETLQVVRKSQRQILVEPQSGVERHLLSPSLVRHGIEVNWLVVPPGENTGVFPAQPPGTIGHITVVRGALRCHLGADEVALEEGDSLTFAADIEHSFTNRDKKPTRCFFLLDISRAHNMRPGR
jgi:transcriptional regulator with XRE-family HTH domain